MSESTNLGIQARSSGIVGIAHMWLPVEGGHVSACRAHTETGDEVPANNIFLIEVDDTPCAGCLEVITFDDPEDYAPTFVASEQEPVAADASESLEHVPEPAAVAVADLATPQQWAV